jgi:hypothetical protein
MFRKGGERSAYKGTNDKGRVKMCEIMERMRSVGAP